MDPAEGLVKNIVHKGILFLSDLGILEVSIWISVWSTTAEFGDFGLLRKSGTGMESRGLVGRLPIPFPAAPASTYLPPYYLPCRRAT